MTTQRNDSVVTILTNRANAVQKYLKPEKATIPVQGKLLGAAALLAVYQKSLDTRAGVVAAHATYNGALGDREAAESVRLAADESLRAWVLARFGPGSTVASDFGFAPRKVPTISVETKQTAVQKRQATRDARGTMGKKQKLKIKGVIATPTAPAAPATTPVPAAPVVASPASTPPASAPAPQVTPPPVSPAPASVPAAPLANGAAAHS